MILNPRLKMANNNLDLVSRRSFATPVFMLHDKTVVEQRKMSRSSYSYETMPQTTPLSSYKDEVVATSSSSSSSSSSSTSPRRGLTRGLFFAMGVTLVILAAIATTSSSRHRRESSLSSLTIPLEGKKNKDKKKKDKKKKDKDEDLPASCEDGKYSKRTLKLAYELPFAALFPDAKGQTKFEASSVFIADDGYAYAVGDASWAISRLGDGSGTSFLIPFAPTNLLIGDPHRVADEDSGYEAIFQDDGFFYVVRESVLLGDEHTSYHAVIEKLDVTAKAEDDYGISQACPAEFEFEGDSKGFEGAEGIRDLDNNLVILGLCEGNYCSEKRKSEHGNGRIVAMRQQAVDPPAPDGSTCKWATVREIVIPSSADFVDYSDISIDANGRVAITSQENSQVWIGSLQGQDDKGLWDIDEMEFDDKNYDVYDFPKDDGCNTIYCNVEGIHWVNENMIMVASDKMKSKGKQDFRCFDKDQSVHLFMLP